MLTSRPTYSTGQDWTARSKFGERLSKPASAGSQFTVLFPTISSQVPSAERYGARINSYSGARVKMQLQTPARIPSQTTRQVFTSDTKSRTIYGYDKNWVPPSSGYSNERVLTFRSNIASRPSTITRTIRTQRTPNKTDIWISNPNELSPDSVHEILAMQSIEKQKSKERNSQQAQEKFTRDVKYFASHLTRKRLNVSNIVHQRPSEFKAKQEGIIAGEAYMSKNFKRAIRKQHMMDYLKQQRLKSKTENRDVNVNKELQKIFAQEISSWKEVEVPD